MAGFVTKTAKTALGILTSRVFGMVRDVCVAAFFGVSMGSDAFFAAFAVPNLFRAFFAEGALSSSFFPFLSDKLSHNGEKSASVFLTSMLLIVGASVILILSAVMLFSDSVAALFLPGYSSNHTFITLTASMIVIVMPYLLFISMGALLSCYLYLKGRFYAPNFSTALLNVVMIISAWLGYKYNFGIMALCYGVFVGGIAQLIFIFFIAYKNGYSPSLSTGFDKDVFKVFIKMFPALAGVGVNQINFMVGRIMASFLISGSISYLYYANRLFQLPLGIFGVAVGTVTLTEISMANSAGDFDKRNEYINKAVNIIILVLLPATAGLIVLSHSIIAFIYGHRHFSGADVNMTAFALRYYSIGLIFFALINIYSRVFYAGKDTSIPMIGAFVGFAVNIVLNFVLMKKMSHGGIALASSIAALFNSGYLYFSIKNYSYSLMKYGVYLMKVVFGAAVMSGVVYFLDINKVNVLLNILFGCAVYFGFLYFSGIKIKEVLR